MGALIKTTSYDTSLLLKQSLIRPELNLLRWSMLFATRKFTGTKRELWFDTRNGRIGVSTGKEILTKNGKTKIVYLTTTEFISFCTLVKLWESAGSPEKEPVLVRLTDFIKLCGKTDGHDNYVRSEDSINRLHTIPITWHGTFKHQTIEDGEEQIHDLNILESMTILGRLRWYSKQTHSTKRTTKAFAFKFHDMLLQNMLGGYTKPYNHRVLIGMKHDIGILTYAHLDTVMANKTRYETWSKRLFEQLGLTGEGFGVRYQKPSLRKKAIEGVLGELKRKPLSTGMITSIEIVEDSEWNDWKLGVSKSTWKVLETSADRYYELNYEVEEALKTANQQDNVITRRFLYKAGRLLGPSAISEATSNLKAYYINDKTAQVQKSLGHVLVKEVKDIAKRKNVSISDKT